MSSSDSITVHMIGNAHRDPVWLWRKSDGVDGVLATARSDRVSGGPLLRRADGREYPWSGVSLLENQHGSLGVLAPDVTSIRVERKGVNLTLLRSPYVAHHDPTPAQTPEHPVTDQGLHTFDVVLYPNAEADNPEALFQQFTRPPITWDLTG